MEEGGFGAEKKRREIVGIRIKHGGPSEHSPPTSANRIKLHDNLSETATAHNRGGEQNVNGRRPDSIKKKRKNGRRKTRRNGFKKSTKCWEPGNPNSLFPTVSRLDRKTTRKKDVYNDWTRVEKKRCALLSNGRAGRNKQISIVGSKSIKKYVTKWGKEE